MHDIERLTLALVVAAGVAPRSAANLLEHLPCDGDLGHLEDNIAAVAHHLRADLDQLVLQGRQRLERQIGNLLIHLFSKGGLKAASVG